MSVERGIIAAEKIAPFAEFVMLYFMGEPLMHPLIFNYIRGVRRKIKGRIAISTNCVLLNEDARSRLLNSGVDMVICSIDGHTKRRYEKIRRGGSFEQVTANVEQLLRENPASGPEIVVKCIDVNLPEDEAANFQNYWTQLGAVTHVAWFNTWAGTIRRRASGTVAPFPYNKRTRAACADLWFKMVINWRGDVVLCCVDWQAATVLGNIFETGVEEIWFGSLARDIRTQHKLQRWNSIAQCAKCSQWSEIGELDIYCHPRPIDYHVIF